MRKNTKKIEIKEWYEHEHDPSVFIMFTKDFEIVWCPSGNELRRGYLENPSDFISGPIEVPITPELWKLISDDMDNF